MNRSGKQGAAVAPLLWAFALAAMLLAVSFSATSATDAHAQQGPQPIDDGGIIVFEECSIVSVMVLDSDAWFTSVFYRFNTDPGVALGVTSQQAGESALIGEVPGGTELILGIIVEETDKTFKTGPGDRNPDNLVHAIVSDEPAVNGTTVEFEDKALGEPNADWDYDDARLQLIIEPCPAPERVRLETEIHPDSTGSGSTSGDGFYDIDTIAVAGASPDADSTFAGWSGSCSSDSESENVLMDADKTCVALFLADPVDPTPEPTPEPTATPEPPVALPSTVGIDNNLVSANPARVGETVTFRVDVTLDVPAENVADVQYTFDDSELAYLGASWNDIALDQCSLSGAGVIDCAFGVVSIDFPFDLHFEALKAANDSTTNATLASDPDGAGPEAAIPAGPAPADVDIIAISGAVPDTGDGSVAAGSGTTSYSLFALLGVTVLATVVGAARLRSSARS